MDPKTCPVLRAANTTRNPKDAALHGDRPSSCLRDECAWWTGDACGVKVLVKSVERLAEWAEGLQRDENNRIYIAFDK